MQGHLTPDLSFNRTLVAANDSPCNATWGRLLPPIDYLDPQLPAGLSRIGMPLIDATSESLRGYGCLIGYPGFSRFRA
jgi:hypothetical protein